VNALAVIGGTGVDRPEGPSYRGQHRLETPYGAPSAPVQEGEWAGCTVFFLQRHGEKRAIPPHRINYRANLWALRELGVREVIAINAVGGISPDMAPGRLVIPDQIIDYTWGREHTVDEGGEDPLMHIDFTEPYDRTLRLSLIEQAEAAGIAHAPRAVYGATQGPRLETAAEIRRMARDGCDVVGMTGMPEAALARELGLAYAAICLVVNPAAGIGDQPLSLAMMSEILEREVSVVRRLLLQLLETRQGGSGG
jgi:5'-methylthioinosine phosphorylase